MGRYIAKRLLQLIPILIGITLLTFLLMHVSSTDAVDVMEKNSGGVWTAEQEAAAREELGLDRPLAVQYVSWLKGFVRGDLGTSYISGQPVGRMFVRRLPNTALLALTAVLLTLLISVPLGVLSAVRHNRAADHVIRALSFIGNSLPDFFVALLLIWLFALKLHVLPVLSSSGGVRGIILPSLTLALAMSAKYTRQIRQSVLEEMNQDYVFGARSRGVPERRILFGSVLKACSITLLTLLALSIGSLLGGTAIVEEIFMWDGVGKMGVDAVLNRDFPVLQAYVAWIAVIYVLIHFAGDILYHRLDPRIRLGEGSRA